MSKPGTTLAVLALFISILSCGFAHAQIPDKFENLKVLPKDIGKRDLVNIMKGMTGALGVRCHFCHVGEEGMPLSEFDFKSDEKEHKLVAREMMKMVNTINNDLMAATKIENPTRVRCVTCHRGVENPETLDNVLIKAAEKDGSQAAVDRYRELRQQYHGSGSYDFGTGTLATVAESIAKSDVEGALAMATLNVEFNPEDAYAHLFLGQLLMQKGDKAEAIKSFERAIAIEPDNNWAKGMLEKAKASE